MDRSTQPQKTVGLNYSPKKIPGWRRLGFSPTIKNNLFLMNVIRLTSTGCRRNQNLEPRCGASSFPVPTVPGWQAECGRGEQTFQGLPHPSCLPGKRPPGHPSSNVRLSGVLRRLPYRATSLTISAKHWGVQSYSYARSPPSWIKKKRPLQQPQLRCGSEKHRSAPAAGGRLSALSPPSSVAPTSKAFPTGPGAIARPTVACGRTFTNSSFLLLT